MSSNEFFSPICECSVGIYNNAASVGARLDRLFLSVEVGLDSLFSYAASHQVVIHSQTWQHDRQFFWGASEEIPGFCCFKCQSSGRDCTLDEASMKCSLLWFNSVVRPQVKNN